MPTVIFSETAAMKPAFQAPHEAMHPGQINYQDFGNNAALKAASDANGYLFEGQRSLNALRQNPNPEHTPARHAKVVSDAIDTFGHTGAAKLESAKNGLKSDLKRVDAEFEARAGWKADPAMKSAVIGTFQGYTDGQRAQALEQLISEGEGSSLATLAETSTVWTKLTPAQRATIRPRLFAKIDPVGFALSQQLSRALDKCDAASIANINGQMQLRQGCDRFADKTRQAEAIAAKATAGFGS